MKTVEVMCPAKLTIKVNDVSNSQGIKNLHVVNQVIDLYDKLELCEDKDKRKYEGIKVISSPKLPIDIEKIYLDSCNLFFEYTSINPKTFNIFIQKNIPLLCLHEISSNIAGILIGLNQYYHTNLSLNEMLYLTSKIDKEASYFIKLWYKYQENNIKKISNNPYYRYLIVNTNNNINLDKNNQLRELLSSEILEYLNNNPDLELNFLSGNVFFIASKEKIFSSKLIVNFHKNFKDYMLYNCQNAKCHKVLIKYF